MGTKRNDEFTLLIIMIITLPVMSGYQPPTESAMCQAVQVETESSILPDSVQFGFHPVTGRNIMLLENGHMYARRIDPEFTSCDAVVYGAKPFKQRRGGVFEVLIDEHSRRQNETIGIGVRMLPTGTEITESDVPKLSSISTNYHCMWFEDKVWNKLSDDNHCKSDYGSVLLHSLQQGDRVGLRVTSNGDLYFYVNGKNQGVAAKDLHEEGFEIYPVVDVRYNCYAVRITKSGW